MPKDINRPLGASGSEAIINSGAEQFFAYQTTDSPATIGITWAQLPDSTQFAGNAAFAGSPAFATSSTNYVWYRLSTAVLENNNTGFVTDRDTIPLWQFDVDGAGVVSNVYDRRPWFGGPTGVLGTLEGLAIDSSGLDFYNRNQRYGIITQGAGAIPGQGAVRWRTAAAPTVSLTDEFEVLAPGLVLGVRNIGTPGVITNLVNPGTITNFNVGTYIYADIDLTNPGAVTPLLSSAAAPPVAMGRVLLASRDAWGVHWIPDNLAMLAADTNSLNEILPAPYGIGKGIQEGLIDQTLLRAALPSTANPFATMADAGTGSISTILSSFNGGGFAAMGTTAPAIAPVAIPATANKVTIIGSIQHTALIGQPQNASGFWGDIDLNLGTYGHVVGQEFGETYHASATYYGGVQCTNYSITAGALNNAVAQVGISGPTHYGHMRINTNGVAGTIGVSVQNPTVATGGFAFVYATLTFRT
jgi:hypothetical protein